MKNHYVFIAISVLLVPVGKSFAAEAEEPRFSSLDRAFLDNQMRDLKTKLDELGKKIKIEEGHQKRSGVLLPLQLKVAELKNNIAAIARQIKFLKKSVDEEYTHVHDALPLDRAQVAAVNAATKEIAVQARLTRVLDAKAMASKDLERLKDLERRLKVNWGVLAEDTLAELTLLRRQKPDFEKNLTGLIRSEEELKKRLPRIQKRSSEEALVQSDYVAMGGFPKETRQRRRVEFGENVVAAILHRDDAEAGDIQPDLAVAHDAAHRKGSSRRNAAYVVEDVVVTPLVADGSVLIQFPRSDLSELVSVPSVPSEGLRDRSAIGFHATGTIKK